ncbi:tetratricopeptide repeat protein [Desulfoprunum benzoelyticum]|uniref:Chemotaxis protein methyltransferase CheR n=1 Tax=Desulfoprunum benzoelyticum TaxID=1506996 RepID=A0A840UQ53_9BACT|nr:chemotaxis protein methyltransferase CheR [Desulfoprunum benzoelyticum]MBM9530331.1 tetratricopeptide repeat protein [Desulfoprunum benzoelyticum]
MRSLSSHPTGAAESRPALLARLSDFVETRLGLHFPPERLGDLERAISSAASEFGFATIDSCIEWLLATALSHRQIETLASHLTVGETYFFRDRRVFDILETQVLPAIIDSRRGRDQHLRIWSAACSSGEEPYSLAILLSRMIPDLNDWEISILATDISPVSLKKAAAGVYGEWSFRETPRWVKEGCFKKREKKFEIDPRIKRMVTFSCLNLAEDPYPAIVNAARAIDIIFCRNVLIYFSRDKAETVIRSLSRCLVDGGWLVVSPVEVPSAVMLPHLHPVRFPGAVLYRKGATMEEIIPRTTTLPAVAAAMPKPADTGAIREPSEVARAVRPAEKPRVPVPAAGGGRTPDQARLLADQGKLAEALAVCAEVIPDDKLNPTLHYLQATILQEMGRTAEAVAALQRALYIDQEFAIAHFALGHLLQGQGRRREAGKHLAKACSLLQALDDDEAPPQAEGMSAGRLIELIEVMQGSAGRG